MLEYEENRVNDLELIGNIHNIKDIYIGMNKRKYYYQNIIDFMIFMLANSPDFIFLHKKI